MRYEERKKRGLPTPPTLDTKACLPLSAPYMHAGDMRPRPDSEEDQKLHSSSCAAWDAYVSFTPSVCVSTLWIIIRVLELCVLRTS